MKNTDPKFSSLIQGAPPIRVELYAETDSLSNRLKNFLKRMPWLYNFLKQSIGPNHSPGSGLHLQRRITQLLGRDPSSRLILNLGSGTNRIHPEVINVDLYNFPNVDIVADIGDVPLADETADAIVCDTVLEHIQNPEAALKEMNRILRPDGVLILTVPFLYPYHSSPNDYHRWTEQGMRSVLQRNNFTVTEIGVLGGPMGSLQAVLMHIFAIIFSFGFRPLYFLFVQLFMAILSPLKIFDLFLMRFPFAIEAASGIYIIATRK